MLDKKYVDLSKHYSEMFSLFDCVHFNSTVSESVYKRNLELKDTEVINISHSDVKDHRRERSFNGDVLSLTFIGNTTEYKGYPLLIDVLNELSAEGCDNWHLNVWGGSCDSENSNVCFCGNYMPSELGKVYQSDGLLVVPSVCNETFSLITIEAMSFGVPVLVSSTVGAKDIVNGLDDWFVFDTRNSLKLKLKELMMSKERLRHFNVLICEGKWTFGMEKHNDRILELYKEIK